jgi:hypothetical protein
MAPKNITLIHVQTAFPKTDGNLFDWVGRIEGPAGTVCLGFATHSPPRLMHVPLLLCLS